MWFRENWTPEELLVIDAQKHSISSELANTKEFTIQYHHIYLASRLSIEFGSDYDVCYEGIFCTDDKKPFGNKAWDQDIAIEMGEKTRDDFQEMSHEEYIIWYKENYLRMYRVFQEMKVVMRIALQNITFKIDPSMEFVKGRHSISWNLK